MVACSLLVSLQNSFELCCAAVKMGLQRVRGRVCCPLAQLLRLVRVFRAVQWLAKEGAQGLTLQVRLTFKGS